MMMTDAAKKLLAIQVESYPGLRNTFLNSLLTKMCSTYSMQYLYYICRKDQSASIIEQLQTLL